MVWFYNLGLRCYYLGIWIATFFNAKANKWIEGRKEFKTQITSQLNLEQPTVWVHCASLGEFEQGRPIIEQIKSQYPQYQLLLTFFSPSGYEIRKNYALADVVTYLPLDTKQNADWLVNMFNLKLAIFVKYDLWYHYLNALEKGGVPSILVAALFRQDQFYFKPYGNFMLNKIKGISRIYVQNTSVKKMLEEHGIDQVVVAGDPRVDRVFNIRRKANKYPLIESFINESDVLIAGSTWPEDEQILLPFINKQPGAFKYIIAPHQIDEKKINAIEGKLSTTYVRYSKVEHNQQMDVNVLIIDNIGMLASLYQYADIAYIGGAFRTGLHNTLEPATFGIPILFGPKYKQFLEAITMINTGGAFTVNTALEFETRIGTLQNQEKRKEAAAKTEAYILENKGATEKIMLDVASYLRND